VGVYWRRRDGDGVGDTPYGGECTGLFVEDDYPLMNPYWNSGDVNHDIKIDLYDVVLACDAYGSKPGDDNWNPHCDIKKPYGAINIFDVVRICASYGKEFEDP